MSTTITPLALSQIGQIMIPVADVDRATHFYRETLGMRFLFAAPPNMAFFDCGGVRLLLGAPEPEPGGAAQAAGILYYRVGDIQQADGALTGRGVEQVSPPHHVTRMPDHDLWMAFYRDSEHNLFGLMSEVPLA
jgi:methylmalonyl-CoA/ethylmalonyl-CoA epimerase